MTRPDAVLLDLDGTLTRGDDALPGAAALVAALRGLGLPHLAVTNTTSRSRAALAARLARLGIPLDEARILTAPRAAAAWLAGRGHARVLPLMPPEVLGDLAPLALAGGTAPPSPAGDPPTAVLVGDLGARWDYALLQAGYAALRDGAALVACSRDRVYRAPDGLALDAGPFVAALEYAAGAEATVVGKPSRAFYAAARAALGVAPGARVVMVGDDLHGDVAGAQGAGIEGWLVLSGKTARADLEAAGIVPDRIVDGVADLLPLVGP